MPTYQRFGSNNHENRKDRRKPAIELNEEPAVVVREMSAALQLTTQDHQLMSERGILSLKPDLRLEWRGQDRHDEPQEPDRSISLGDSITSATRIRFLVHTTPIRRVWKAGLSRDPVPRALAQHGREASCTQGPWTLQQVNSALEAVDVGGGRDARRSAAEDGMRPIAPVWRGLA
jgi:hypothetical protein